MKRFIYSMFYACLSLLLFVGCNKEEDDEQRRSTLLDKNEENGLNSNDHNPDSDVLEASSSDLVYFILSDSEVEVAGFNVGSVKMSIPEKVRIDGNAYTVTSIGKFAFYMCERLTSIEIPSSVTNIGESAFVGSGLTNITIPSSVKNIEKNAIASSVLTRVDVASENPYYSSVDGILYNKNKTEIIYIPLAIIGPVSIPSSITSIDGFGFSACTKLRSIEIPASITVIKYFNFNGCANLTNIKLPSTLTAIEGMAFANCTSLTQIEIPSNVISIGYAAFSGCSNLTSIKLPSKLTTIEMQAFEKCTSLTQIEIPSSVTSIGAWTFSKCSNLDVVIDNSSDNVEVGLEAFEDCKSVTYKK